MSNTASLKKEYAERIAPALMKQFNYSSPMQVPVLKKIVINEGLGAAPEQAEEAVKAYREYYGVTGLFENKVYEGIPALLRDLRAAGKTLAVATSKPEAFSVRILEKFGLAQYFHHIGGASFDSSRSSKSAVVAYSLGLCGNPSPETVVMVGDRKHDVEGAINNGLQSIGVLYGYGDRPELEAAGATAIAESVEQLRAILLG